MTDREYIEKLERRIQELDARFKHLTRGALLALALVTVAVATASTPTTGRGVLESRMRALESLIRTAPNGTAQVRAPFQVLDGQGKVLLNVGDRGANGAVNVTRAAGVAAPNLSVMGDRQEAVRIGVSQSGHGRVLVNDADGKASAVLNEAGLNVYNTQEVRVAGVTRGPDGRGRVVIWHDDDQTAAQLSADQEGNGRILSHGANGKIRVDLNGELGITVMDDAEKGVVSVLNRDGRGVVGVKASISNKLTAEMTVDSGGGGILHMKAPDGKTAIGLYAARRVIALGNSQGSTVAEMVVHPAGYGLFQVWAGGKMPLAVLGKSADHFGGVLQISNGQAVISSVTVSPGGNGMWQLNDAAGKPVIEAGINGGLGTVRVGPLMRCLPRPSSLVLPDCLLGRAQ